MKHYYFLAARRVALTLSAAIAMTGMSGCSGSDAGPVSPTPTASPTTAPTAQPSATPVATATATPRPTATPLNQSPVRLASMQAEVATQRVRLTFTGPLDPATARNSRIYRLAVNGGTIGFPTPTYEVGTRTVSFQVGDNASPLLKTGDRVGVLISGLNDAQGRELPYINRPDLDAIAR